jgi:hypothetical protein
MALDLDLTVPDQGPESDPVRHLLEQADRLVRFRDLIRLLNSYGAERAALTVRGIYYAAKIRSLIEHTVDYESVQRHYHKSRNRVQLGAVDPWKTPTVTSYLRNLTDGWDSALASFLSRIKEELPRANLAPFEMLETEIRASLRPPQPVPTEGKGSASGTYAVFAVQPHTTDTFIVHGFVFHAGDWSPLKVDDSKIRRPQLKERFGDLVAAAHRKLPKEADPTIEVALPLDWLNDEIDAYETTGWLRKKRAGVAYRLVLRSADRIFDAGLRSFEGRWKSKWEALSEIDEGSEHVHCIRQEHEVHCNAFYTSPMVVAATLKPSPTGSVTQQRVLEELIESGTPVAVWLRVSVGALEEVWPTLEELTKGPPNRLPTAVHKVRGATGGPAGSVGNHLALLFDDHSRQLPVGPRRRKSITP